MFGYVRARWDILSPEERQAYQSAYCGVCHAMGKHYGQFSRLFLNYDFAFLAMLLAPSGPIQCNDCKRCLLHPIKGHSACNDGTWFEQAAGESVILTYWKLKDSVLDHSFLSGLPARFLCFCLSRSYRKAKRRYPSFDREVIYLLKELNTLEREKSPSIDKTADCFARLLRAAAPTTCDEGQNRALAQLLYHIGRWIYLIDAVDDFDKDQRTGNYNPIAARFPEWSDSDRDYLFLNLTHSLSMAGSAFQLLKKNSWSSVIENILYYGLPNVTELVFCGKWNEYKNRRGTTTDERSL